MVITGNNSDKIKALKEHFSKEFEIKDLSYLKYFLGIEVSISNSGIFLSQGKYILDLLKETWMSGCQRVNTLVEEWLKLCIEEGKIPIDKGRYQRLVGKLMYLAHTRPDLAYALSIVSQFMRNLGEKHMEAAMRILRYLKFSLGRGILFKKNSVVDDIVVYTDADKAGALVNKRSTSGYFTFVGGILLHGVARNNI